jgi:hypothetical protein
MGSLTGWEIATRRVEIMRVSTGGVIALALAVVAAVVLGIGVASLGPELREPSTLMSQLTGDEAGAGDGAGYSFTYPASWEMETDGAVSKVSSPGRRVVVSVGPGPDGTLRQTSDAFVASIDRQYEGVDISSRENLSLDGNPALLTGGTAVNERGTEMSVYAIAIDKAGGSYIVAGFSDTAAVEPTTLSARVREIAQTLDTPARS